MEGCNFILNLSLLHICELTKTHLNDSLSLNIIKTKTLHKTCFCTCSILAVSDDFDYLVNKIKRNLQALENVSSVTGFFEVKISTTANNLSLKFNIALEHFLEWKNFRLAVNDRKHNCTEGCLQLCVWEQLVKNNLRWGISLDVNFNVHTLTVGMILDIWNTLNSLILYEVGNVFNKSCFVDLVRKLRNDNFISAVFSFDNFSLGSYGDFSSTCCIGGTNTASAHDNTACRKVGSGHTLHNLCKLGIGIVNESTNCVNCFTEVMRRNFGCHTNGNTAWTVYEKVWKTAWKNSRFFKTVIIVWHKVNRVFLDIREHFKRNFTHSCLCITVSSRRITVHRTEVTVTVNKHISHGKILCKTNHCVINRGVTVRVIRTKHLTYRIGTLVVRLWRIKTDLIHCIEYSSVNRFQTVSDIGQRTGNNNAHGVVQKAFSHFILQIDINNSRILVLILFVIHILSSLFKLLLLSVQ